MKLTISLEDFERARQMWGEPRHLPLPASVLRTVWQIRVHSGRNFDSLIIVYPEGSWSEFPLPANKESHILSECRPSRLMDLPDRFGLKSWYAEEIEEQSPSVRRPDHQKS